MDWLEYQLERHLPEPYTHILCCPNRAKNIRKGRSQRRHQSSGNYAADAKALAKTLPASFPSADTKITPSTPLTIFLTGATGFLGAYILHDLITRSSPPIRVIAHVRAIDSPAALNRISQTCQAYAVWDPSWFSRITCVTENLGERHSFL